MSLTVFSSRTRCVSDCSGRGLFVSVAVFSARASVSVAVFSKRARCVIDSVQCEGQVL